MFTELFERLLDKVDDPIVYDRLTYCLEDVGELEDEEGSSQYFRNVAGILQNNEVDLFSVLGKFDLEGECTELKQILFL